MDRDFNPEPLKLGAGLSVPERDGMKQIYGGSKGNKGNKH
jgi:hypothetical protein